MNWFSSLSVISVLSTCFCFAKDLCSVRVDKVKYIELIVMEKEQKGRKEKR